jgi:hypothetical protein
VIFDPIVIDQFDFMEIDWSEKVLIFLCFFAVGQRFEEKVISEHLDIARYRIVPRLPHLGHLILRLFLGFVLKMHSYPVRELHNLGIYSHSNNLC